MRYMMLVRSVAPAGPMEVKVDLGCDGRGPLTKS
jgi:hypothetical protein